MWNGCAGKIDARLPASEPNTPPAQMPATLELPLAIDIDTLTLGELSLLQGPPATSSPLVLSGLSGAVHSDGQRHRIVIDRLVTPTASCRRTVRSPAASRSR
jgi:translocation and assembly module TamB